MIRLLSIGKELDTERKSWCIRSQNRGAYHQPWVTHR